MSEVIAIIAGMLAGTSGIIPFIHTNSLLQITAASGGAITDSLSLALFAVALSFSHAVFEIMPAIFFAVPSATQAISVLPAQKMARQGQGIKAMKIMLYSLVAGAMTAILAAPAAALALPAAYAALKPLTAIALATVLIFLVLNEKQSRLNAIAIMALSGALGIVVLRISPGIAGNNDLLFPLLTGLFALPALLIAMQAPKLPKQENCRADVDWKLIMIGSILGVCSGLLPAMSPAILAGMVFIFLESKPESFLAIASSIAGSKLVGDIVILGFMGKARSGMAAIAGKSLGSPTIQETTILLLGALIALSLATCALMLAYPRLVRFFCEKNYDGLRKAFLAGLIIMLVVFGGAPSLFIAGIACCIGLIPVLLNARRSLCCAALIAPALAFFM